MLRHSVVRGLLLGLAVGPLLGCSLAGKRDEVRLEKLQPVPGQPAAAGPKMPPAVKTAGANSPAGARTNEVTPVKAETTKIDPAVVPVAGPPPAKPAGPTLPPPERLPQPLSAGDQPAGGDKPVATLPPPVDPHLRPAPTAYGSLLQMPPGESPVERALALTRQVERLGAERAALALRIAALEEAIQTRDKQAAAVTRQVEDATSEMTRARADLTRWADDLREQQARLRQQEKENHELLRSVITTLERVATASAPEPSKAPTSEP